MKNQIPQSQKYLRPSLHREGTGVSPMKKIYQKPTLDITDIQLVSMVATSLRVDENTTVDEQYTKENRSDWSNIWE